MMKKYSVRSLVLAFCLCFAMAMPVFATDDVVDNNISDIDLDLLVTGLLNGDIQPVNESEDDLVIDIVNDSATQIDDVDIMSLNDNDVDINTKDQIVDIRKIDDDENSDVETYVATVIFTNEYKFNESNDIMPLADNIKNENDENECYGVIVSCSVRYEKLPLSDTSLGQMYGYKIKSVTGTYVSTNDSQMRCKSLYVMAAGAGIGYESANSNPVLSSEDPIIGPTINSPEIGRKYTTVMNQQYYYCNTVLFAANAASTYFTVARINSDFTADSYIQISVLPKTGV